MPVLYFLEGIRTPFFDTVFSLLTHLGEETVFMVITVFIFWCVSKRNGYYLLLVGYAGTIANQCLKLLFCIPRPWVIDPKFTIVESARAEATGYSFPSGHTQSAVGVFGGIARFTKKKWLRIVAIILLVLVSFSRMYLGVHTPLDVGVSFLIGTLLVFALYPLMERIDQVPNLLLRIIIGIVLLSGAYVLFVELYPFPADIDATNLASGVENAYKMLGATLGLMVGFLLDNSVVHFDTKAVWWAQLLKLVLGMGLLLLIQKGLKAPLLALFQGGQVAGTIRYFLMVLFASGIWPMTFAWFGRLGEHR
jgi:membrane-associated phospholipid phosphatase